MRTCKKWPVHDKTNCRKLAKRDVYVSILYVTMWLLAAFRDNAALSIQVSGHAKSSPNWRFSRSFCPFVCIQKIRNTSDSRTLPA
jgi:hypothetical protein